jgi:hypothetical protein
VIAKLASGLCVLALAAGCKERPEPAPRTTTGSAGSGSARPANAPVPIDAPAVSDAAFAAAADAAPAPIDAAIALPEVTKVERAMVASWFGKLNGAAPLAIKGVDVEPFRKAHSGFRVDATTKVTYAAVPKEGKRTFALTQFVIGDGKRSAGAPVFMTFDAKDQLVGISY